MEDFLKGFTGVGFGFLLFMPSHLMTSNAAQAGDLSTAPLTFRIPLFLGLALMFVSPFFFFWGVKPLKRKITGEERERVSLDEVTGEDDREE